MSGPMIMSPSSLDHDAIKSAIEGAAPVPKRKKSVIGRIKKKLSTKLGRRKSMSVASPTPQDLIKREPEIAEVDDSQQQNEEDENNAEAGDKGDLSLEQLSSEPEVDGPSDRMDSVLEFNASLENLETVVDGEYISEAKEEFEQKSSPTPEQFDDDSDVDEGVIERVGSEEVEIIASHNEVEEAPLGTDNHVDTECGDSDQQTPSEEDDDDMLEVFENGEGNQSHHSSPRQPEDDDEGDEELPSDETDADSPFEPWPPIQNVDLVIVGVTPMSLRNLTTYGDAFSSYERCEFQEEKEPLETELDVVATPRIYEPLSSPLKRVRPGPAVEMMSSISPLGNNLPHPPLQDIREEDDSYSSGDVEQFSAPTRKFGGRQHALVASEAPILSSAAAQICPQYDELEASSPNDNEIEEKYKESRTGDEDDEEDFETLDSGALITRAFGERIVTLLAADPWGDRQDGFDAVKLAVKKADVSTIEPVIRQRLLCASLAAVQCGVEDRVVPVMLCALECLRAVLKEFARVLLDERAFANAELKSAAVLNNQLSSLVGALVRKLSDSNKRTQRESTQALVRVARVRSLRALPHLLLHLSGREVPPRRQLETLRRLMQELGLTNSTESSPHHHQLTAETVLQFVAPSLKIAEEKTRKAAVDILADLQTRTGNSTAWHSQLARAGAVKPEMLRVITRRVEELLAKREELQAASSPVAPGMGNTATNQAEEQVDDEAAFPPAELVDVPQEDAQSSITLLEVSLLNAQNVVGPVCWRKLACKTWSDRKEALLDVEKAMTEAKSDLRDTRPAFGSAAQSTFVAYSALLHRALGDSIAPVVNTALDTFATLVKIYGPRVEWREADVRDITLLTLLRLLAAMQKPNTRTTRAACRGVLKLARLPNARHPLRYVLSCIFGGEGSSACDPQVQMHLLRLLVPEFGFQADGLGASRVLEVVSKGLTHSSARVRRSAADVALSAQRLLGRDYVLARLQGVKPVTLKELEKSFVDGIGGSGGGERPQTVHATAAEASAPAAIGGPDLPPVTFGGLGEFSSRRLLSSAPVGIGRLQCTPLYEEVSATPSPPNCASVLSNEEENLMDAILGADDFQA
ncbi:hypothetical protein PF010_g9675 [Phytophthora fragariae]|uniref:TOG domain-containing protein n=8 Tax=Phytophthora fragariae TaxID=53985 RepID=A0A6A3SC84_9STRA|nr:hypothetical protein PF003_g15948 [Phytophthora fragariae]KAE8938595.1 hypothetical protein PF009_g11517 [Phytophthora fragariae]KAE9011991.1 hypothetical protein PF011_g9129 [Phytophthora fragariae]KAE9114129.1 hypothetical protein PF007_g10496 [Phytophthora fragariae]KAE9114493.1 hypothetical protein PF010_g9675 [Phytophthora fragariae]